MREVKQVNKDFEMNVFGSKLRNIVIKTIECLAQTAEDLKSDSLSRYDFEEVRKFVLVSSLNPEISA